MEQLNKRTCLRHPNFRSSDWKCNPVTWLVIKNDKTWAAEDSAQLLNAVFQLIEIILQRYFRSKAWKIILFGRKMRFLCEVHLSNCFFYCWRWKKAIVAPHLSCTFFNCNDNLSNAQRCSTFKKQDRFCIAKLFRVVPVSIYFLSHQRAYNSLSYPQTRSCRFHKIETGHSYSFLRFSFQSRVYTWDASQPLSTTHLQFVFPFYPKLLPRAIFHFRITSHTCSLSDAAASFAAQSTISASFSFCVSYTLRPFSHAARYVFFYHTIYLLSQLSSDITNSLIVNLCFHSFSSSHVCRAFQRRRGIQVPQFFTKSSCFILTVLALESFMLTYDFAQNTTQKILLVRKYIGYL